MSLFSKVVYVHLLVCIVNALWDDNTYTASDRSVLVFGGNGFLGSETVSALIELGCNVTIVNRGGRYWDAEERVFSRVRSIECDREKKLEDGCPQLFADPATDRYDFVIDFSAKNDKYLNDTFKFLQNKVSFVW